MLQGSKLEITPNLDQLARTLRGDRFDNLAGYFLLRGEHYRDTWLNNTCLLTGDLSQGASQDLGVVVGKRSDYRDGGENDVRSIQAPTQAHFDHGCVYLLASKMKESQR